MQDIKTKLEDLKNRLKDRHMVPLAIVILILIAALIILGMYIYNKEREYQMVAENTYNMSFYELVNCVDEIETYIAKAEITSSAEHTAKTLSHIWNKSNLAVVYLSQIPIKTEGLSSAEKFLNQVSDYSYSLSMKAIKGEDMKEEELKNLEDLHSLIIDLKNVLYQLEREINDRNTSMGRAYKRRKQSFCTASKWRFITEVLEI